jgi:NAD(P)-dependent dehydrogenase (short-subunit alcohol dehydrogenase family)
MSAENLSDLLSLTGQRAVVTGGAGGLGRAIATTLAAHGATVVILDKDAAGAEKAASDIEARFDGVTGVGLGIDVADAESVSRTFDDERLSVIDILVNSAGVREIAPAEELSPSDWENVVDINLNGTFYCIRYAIEPLKRAAGGSIVNIASVAGLIAMANRPAYSATKHAIVGLTRNLAHDLGKYGIRVNAIAPGTIRTPMTESYYGDPDFVRSLQQIVPLNREGTVDDIARAALFFSSPLSQFVSGAILPVDGGWLAQKNYMAGGASAAYLGAE